MYNRKVLILFGVLFVSLLLISACGAGTGGGSAEPTPTPTPDFLGGESNSSSGSGSDYSADTEPQPEQPKSTVEPTLPSPEERDSCLIGTWVIDEEAFRAYMTQSMNVSDQAQFEFGEIEGNFEMVIDEEIMAYTSIEPMNIDLKMIAGGVELVSLEMLIVGAGDAYWLTYENYFIVYGQDYNFFGNGLGDVLNTDMLGQAAVSVTLTPDTFVSMASFTNLDIAPVLRMNPQIENYAVATYTCEGDVFTYQFGEYEAVWLRK